MPTGFALSERPSADRWNPPRIVPRPPDRSERREHIRRVAARLFAAEGDAVSIARLTAAVGLPPGAVATLYGSRQAALGDVLDAYLADLNTAVGAAYDEAHASGADPTPERRLEVVVRGFVDATARHADAHRAFLVCVHRLEEAERRSALLRYQLVLETVLEVLAGAIPGLAKNAAVSETLLGTIRILLSDPWRWQAPLGPPERQAEARRIAAILLATAAAEKAGYWPAVGKTTGTDPALKTVTLDLGTARARLGDVVKAAELGADITLTRYGRRVARVVAAG